PVVPVAGEKEGTLPAKGDAVDVEITPAQFISDHIEPALKAMSKYEGYICTFHKREWAKPLLGGYRLTDETITLKVRHDPASAYLYFHEPKEKRGTEALYV